MDTRKLLVADPSQEFCDALTCMVGGAYELRICHDGLDARALLQSFQPDVLVMDLTLPGLDGISVLREMGSSPVRPAILVTTRFLSPYIEAAIAGAGVDYMMLKPCDMQALAEHIQDLTLRPAAPILPASRATVRDILLALNIPAKRRGFECLEAAITLYEQDPLQSVTKVLYPAVAKQCGGSGVSVERSIRGAIWYAWTNRDEKIWRMYFHACADGFVPRPTNMTFIASIAQCLRQQERDRAQ